MSVSNVSNSNSSSNDASVISGLTFDQRQRLTDLLDSYLVNLEKGLPTNVDRMLEDNSDIAKALSSYLGHLDALHHVAAGFANPEENVASSTDAETQKDTYSDEQRLGDFVLGREIGRGGMGVVYEAHQISLDRKVALKLLPFAAVLDQHQIARFKNEAQAAAQLCHPNIVPVYAVGAERGVNYYAMKLIEGQPLDQAIEELRGDPRRDCPATRVWSRSESKPLDNRGPNGNFLKASPSDVKRSTGPSVLTCKQTAGKYYQAIAGLGIQAANALHAAHEYGVVHRDIKPSNLLLDPNGKLWITDFGLARCQSNVSLTKSGDLLGTMRYMSPEQALGQSVFVDHRTDVYSLGITLYELITLRNAFDGENSPALLRQIESEEPRRPRLMRPDLPIDLESVVLKAMAKLREDRYETAADLAADLQRFINGRATVARPPTMWERSTKWIRRHRRFVVIAAATAAAVLIATNIVLGVKAHSQQQVIQKKVEAGNFGIRMARKFATIGGPEARFVAHNVIPELLSYYQSIASQKGKTIQQRAEVADAQLQMGMLHAQIHETDRSLASFCLALEKYRDLIEAEPGNQSFARQYSTCQAQIADVYRESRDVASSRRLYVKAVSRLESLIGKDSQDLASKSQLASARNGLGLLLAQTGDADGAKVCFRTAVELLLEVVKETGDDDRRLATFYKNLGSVISDGRESLAWNAKAIDAYQSLIDVAPNDKRHRHLLALALNERGKIQNRLGQSTLAIKTHLDAIERLKPLQESDPANRVFLADLGLCFHDKALAHGKQEQVRDALRDFQTAIEAQSQLVVRYPTIVSYASTLGGMYNNLGMVLERAGRIHDATASFEKAIQFQQIAFNAQPEWTGFQLFLDNHLFNYGRACRRLGKRADAAAAALRRKDLFGDDPTRLVSVAAELAMLVEQTEHATRRDLSTADNSYADAAVATLRRARDLGWSPDDDMPSELDNLRPFREYQAVLNN